MRYLVLICILFTANCFKVSTALKRDIDRNDYHAYDGYPKQNLEKQIQFQSIDKVFLESSPDFKRYRITFKSISYQDICIPWYPSEDYSENIKNHTVLELTTKDIRDCKDSNLVTREELKEFDVAKKNTIGSYRLPEDTSHTILPSNFDNSFRFTGYEHPRYSGFPSHRANVVRQIVWNEKLQAFDWSYKKSIIYDDRQFISKNDFKKLFDGKKHNIFIHIRLTCKTDELPDKYFYSIQTPNQSKYDSRRISLITFDIDYLPRQPDLIAKSVFLHTMIPFSYILDVVVFPYYFLRCVGGQWMSPAGC
ncbi:hypothetical protein [Leptospira meyeri]|uniref:hypothetical protein n=1 Tax=Leptospira meyeri TaxID=29508 RepID=UPI0010827B5E|nr:hypothetical protein [Leptospira meyeri]TGL14256.1 hypothetical protein EHQ50_07510 [Leptospira meyeri]